MQVTAVPSRVASDRPLRAGLVGAGHIAEFHARALDRLVDVQLVAVADLDLARAEALAAEHHVATACRTLNELLENDLDVLHVLTPPSAHVDNVIQALQAGCHVLVEKPLATSVAEADRILETAGVTGRTVCVDHSLLRDPFVLRAQKLVQSGAIGDVLSVDHLRSQHYSHFTGGRLPELFRDGGYPFRDIGVHSLYLLESFLGRIRDVDVRLGSLENDGYPRVKEWRVQVECERGLGNVYLSWNQRPLQDLLVIHGTRGVIKADIFGMSVTARRQGRLPEKAERIANTALEGCRMVTQVSGSVLRFLTKRLRQYHGLQALVGEFYENLRTGQPAPVALEDARRVLLWTEHVAEQGDAAKERYVGRFAEKGTAEVLVTGATGFIGRHLLRRLLKERDRMRVLVRRTPEAAVFESDRVETFFGDLGDPESVARACEGIREVFHLGATVAGDAEDFQGGTLAGTQNIIDACLEAGVEKLIYMSSLSVLNLAAAKPTDQIQEDWPYEPYPAARGLYTQTKLAAEQMVLEAVANQGLSAVLLRPGEVFGPDKIFLSGAVGKEAAGRVLVLGGGKALVPLIWVEDLVDAILAAAERGPFDGAIYNLVDPAEVTQDELAEYYLAAQGRPRKIWHLPLLLLKPAAAGLQLGMKLLRKNSPITPYRLKSAIGTRRFDCSAAQEQLGWCPRIGIRKATEKVLADCHRNAATDRRRAD